MKISMTTKPLKYPNGFLILKINKKRIQRKNRY